MYKYTCIRCGKYFESKNYTRKFCSSSCSTNTHFEDGMVCNKKQGTFNACPVCDKKFYVTEATAKYVCCSRSCAGKHAYRAGVAAGKLAVFPRGNKKSNYYQIKNGVKVHRAVAEKKIGRKILKSEEVHHCDGDHTNNAPCNLAVISRSEHRSLHAKERLGRLSLVSF